MIMVGLACREVTVTVVVTAVSGYDLGLRMAVMQEDRGKDGRRLLPECEVAGRGTGPLVWPRRSSSRPIRRSAAPRLRRRVCPARPGNWRAAGPDTWPVRDVRAAP